MKTCLEIIVLFLIIEIKTEAFVVSDSANSQDLQEAKLARISLEKDLNKLINDELREEGLAIEKPHQSSTSYYEISNHYQNPTEQSEQSFYPNEADNSAYVATTENYFNHANVEDGYKPLLYEDSRSTVSTEMPFELLKATSPSPTNNAKPPSIPELPFGLPNGQLSNTQGSQTPTLIMGGFSILVMPMPGLTPSNMANLFQSGQQLGQASGTNPFLGTYPATG